MSFYLGEAEAILAKAQAKAKAIELVGEAINSKVFIISIYVVFTTFQTKLVS